MDNAGLFATEIALIIALMALALRMITLSRKATETSGVTVGGPTFRKKASQKTGAARERRSEGSQKRAGMPGRPHQGHRQVESVPQSQRASDITAQLHILASVQLLDAHRQGLTLKTSGKNLKSLAAAYLYGAAIELTFDSELNRDQAFALAIKSISHNLDLGEVSVHQMLATLTQSSSSLECYRNGLEGAEFWSTHHYVPKEQSLYTSLTSNALI